MRSVTGAGEQTPATDPAPPAGRTRLLTSLAVAGIVGSILIMIAASVLRNGWNSPVLVLPRLGPPWGVQSRHLSAGAASVALWIAVLAGTGGVIAGLVAVRRGARPSIRAVLIAAGIAVAALTVLPVAGSNDALDYAAYGRIMAIGHSPYVMKPQHLILLHNAFSHAVPGPWRGFVSVYGPLATFEQFLAAKLGGLSAARITFWLKLWDSIAFALVAFVADRLLRGDPARRLRAHLLWTINPLLLWDVIAAGHLDVLAAAAGLLGLLALGRHSEEAPTPLLRVIAAGALIGVAVDVKANYLLFGLAAAWVLRRSLAALAAGVGAALVVLAPGYAYFGIRAVHAVIARRNGLSADSMYRFVEFPPTKDVVAPVAALLVIAVAALLFRRLPFGSDTGADAISAGHSATPAASRGNPSAPAAISPGSATVPAGSAAIPGGPALWVALVLTLAWLFFWPYEYPWYDVMIICLLMLYPASRLDWLVLARIAAGTLANVPGNPNAALNWLIGGVHHGIVEGVAPVVLLAAAVALIVFCRTGHWGLAAPADPPLGTAPQPDRLMPTATS